MFEANDAISHLLLTPNLGCDAFLEKNERILKINVC